MARFSVVEGESSVIYKVDVFIGQISAWTNGCPMNEF